MATSSQQAQERTEEQAAALPTVDPMTAPAATSAPAPSLAEAARPLPPGPEESGRETKGDRTLLWAATGFILGWLLALVAYLIPGASGWMNSVGMLGVL